MDVISDGVGEGLAFGCASMRTAKRTRRLDEDEEPVARFLLVRTCVRR